MSNTCMITSDCNSEGKVYVSKYVRRTLLRITYHLVVIIGS